MEIFKHFNETQNVYMELTHRIHGGEGWDFGSVLWSPAYGKRRDTWGIMRDVKANDIIDCIFHGKDTFRWERLPRQCRAPQPCGPGARQSGCRLR